MARFARIALTLTITLACDDRDQASVGDPCLLHQPCDVDGARCELNLYSWYRNQESDHCGSMDCIIGQRANGRGGAVASEPGAVCDSATPANSCQVPEAVERAIYCSCRCGAPAGADRSQLCACPTDYTCSRLASGDSYCLKPDYAL